MTLAAECVGDLGGDEDAITSGDVIAAKEAVAKVVKGLAMRFESCETPLHRSKEARE